jgi:hypothetical protein
MILFQILSINYVAQKIFGGRSLATTSDIFHKLVENADLIFTLSSAERVRDLPPSVLSLLSGLTFGTMISRRRENLMTVRPKVKKNLQI